MASVVIAEGDSDLLESYTHILTRAGHSVVPCKDADSALAEVHQQRPDLLLTDVTMTPGMTGLELAAAIRADPAVADLPIIAVTGGWTEIDATELPRIARLLRKPVSPEELTSQVQTVLANARRHHVHLRSDVAP
ncbi:response regulator [Planosporangium mesophilum]|uniref:Response regulator n=1 Tax=Planosporangium mesophilum TaxID=689768 RepID=A0A8J3TB60_9ACTN|nr:response regulator [Planosporangium mesophilum]NJC84611.1 response regulator [Planosporangium mesophilum]GII23920.1 response regulator [Planosporangium mesophilum]